MALTVCSFSPAVAQTDNSLNEVLLAYSLSLEQYKKTESVNFSPGMLDLINDRLVFYDEFFKVGLNSELTRIESIHKIERLTIDESNPSLVHLQTKEQLNLYGKYNLDRGHTGCGPGLIHALCH